jgi:hypothetical protein
MLLFFFIINKYYISLYTIVFSLGFSFETWTVGIVSFVTFSYLDSHLNSYKTCYLKKNKFVWWVGGGGLEGKFIVSFGPNQD